MHQSSDESGLLTALSRIRIWCWSRRQGPPCPPAGRPPAIVLLPPKPGPPADRPHPPSPSPITSISLLPLLPAATSLGSCRPRSPPSASRAPAVPTPGYIRRPRPPPCCRCPAGTARLHRPPLCGSHASNPPLDRHSVFRQPPRSRAASVAPPRPLSPGSLSRAPPRASRTAAVRGWLLVLLLPVAFVAPHRYRRWRLLTPAMASLPPVRGTRLPPQFLAPPSPADTGMLGVLGQLWTHCSAFCASLEMDSAGGEGSSCERDRARRGACRGEGTCRLLSGWCSCSGVTTVWAALSMYSDA